MKSMVLSRTLLLAELLFLLVPSQQHEEPRADASAEGSCAALPHDFVDPCRDRHASCADWAAEGECARNPNYMSAQCARSCGTCRGGAAAEAPPVAARCGDADARCATWALAGECWKNPSYMTAACRASCWECVDAAEERRAGVAEDVVARKVAYGEVRAGAEQAARDDEGVAAALVEMERYAKHALTAPSVAAKARERCRNAFPRCAAWAAGGMCPPHGATAATTTTDGAAGRESAAVFMMNACPLACRRCEELARFHRCAGRRHPRARPAFRPGELGAFFEGHRAAGDASFASRPTADREERRNDPYVAVFRNFLSGEEVDRLRALGSASAAGAAASSAGEGPFQKTARVRHVRCREGLCEGEEIYQRILRRISSLATVAASHLEPLEFVHRRETDDPPPGTALRHNYEASGRWLPAGPRVLSLFVFLADDDGRDEGGGKGGGGIGFPYLDWLRVRPNKGAAVLWPNVRDDAASREPLTAYEHFPGKGGSGESLVGVMVSVMLYNWTDANVRRCTSSFADS